MSKITAQMLKAAKAELRRREERAALKADCEKDLMAFVEAFWPVVEPATPLIKGWVLEAMCDVLMAAADGHLHRICINVPPGSMKSTMLNVFYPAWLWGAQNKPHLRFISASYSTMIPERDNGRLLRVIQSDLFRQFWGDRVQVVREGVGLVETSATGWKRVVSTGGGTTGHRGDYVLCLERSARILTSQGEMAVGDIVDERREVLVAGWSGAGVRWQKIECYEINPPGRMVRIGYAGRSLVCTIDHPIWVEGRGFVRAEHVRPGDVLKGMSRLLGAGDERPDILQQGLLRKASSAEARCGYRAVCGLRDRLLQAASTYGAGRKGRDVQPGVLALEQQRGEQLAVCRWKRPGNLPPLWQGHSAQSVRSEASHGLFDVLCPQNELGRRPQSADAQAMPSLRGVLCSVEQGIKTLLAEVCGGGSRQENGWQREWSICRRARGAPDRMGDGAAERPGASLRSLWGGISAKIQNVAVLRPVLSACRAWGESLRAKEWTLGSWPGELWVSAGMDGGVSRIHPPARREPVSALQYDRGSAREGVAGASHRLPEGKSRHIEPDHGLPLLSWADARAPGGPGEMEGIVVRSVEFIGETGEPTYNLRVGPDHNYFVEGVLAHNCDDLNDPNNVESETIRAGTSHWLREVMPDRVNNLKTSVIINIQQRTHEQDATGVLLQFGYTHIVVPMEFDPSRFQHVVLRRNKAGEATQVWADPRGLDKDGNELEGLVVRAHGGMEAAPGSPMARAEGTLCWPERYPPDEMEKMKTIKGPYAFASQYQQLPTVRGGAIIRREWWRRWRGMVLPEFGTIIASLDTAIKEGTENDYNALTIVGAFADDEGAPQFMLADAWRVRTNLADLVRMVGDACRKHNVDYLLIEDKARGHDVAAEIRRLYATAPWDTQLLKIGGGRYAQDKVTRVMAITPMFSGPVRKDPATGMDIWDGGMVWAPETDWAEEVIAETTSFPRGAHDDYCFVAGTQVITPRGPRAIETIQVGDSVLTPLGWFPVTAAGCTGEREVIERIGLTGTCSHPIFDIDHGYVPLDTVTQSNRVSRISLCDLIRTIPLISSHSSASATGAWEAPENTTFHKPQPTRGGRARKACMSLFGSIFPGESFPKGMRSTIRTAILLTASLRIWSAYQRACIVGFLGRTCATIGFWRILPKFDLWPLNGTGLKQALRGTKSTGRTLWQRLTRQESTPPHGLEASASIAEAVSSSKPRQNGSVVFCARAEPKKGLVSALRRHASGAALPLCQPAARQNFALRNAGKPSIRPDTSPSGAPVVARVYNLTVDGPHCYYANGLLVHNCDCLAQMLLWARKTGLAITKAEFREAEDEAMQYQRPVGVPYAIHGPVDA